VNMMCLLVGFFVLRVMIQYHIIPLSPLASLIIVSHQIFVYVACMILAMILLLWRSYTKKNTNCVVVQDKKVKKGKE
jgi:hypothetical protein